MAAHAARTSSPTRSPPIRDEQRHILARGDEEQPAGSPTPRRRRTPQRERARALRASASRRQGYASVVHRASGEIMHAGLDPARRGERRSTSSSRGSPRGCAEPRADAARRVGRRPRARPTTRWPALRACESVGAARRSGRSTWSASSTTSRRCGSRSATRCSSRTCTTPRPSHVLRFGEWRSESAPLVWTLLEGDFRAHLHGTPRRPDLHLLRSRSPRRPTRRCGRSSASSACSPSAPSTTPSSSPTRRRPRCARRMLGRRLPRRARRADRAPVPRRRSR